MRFNPSFNHGTRAQLRTLQPTKSYTDPPSSGGVEFQRKCAVEVIGPDRFGAVAGNSSNIGISLSILTALRGALDAQGSRIFGHV